VDNKYAVGAQLSNFVHQEVMYHVKCMNNWENTQFQFCRCNVNSNDARCTCRLATFHNLQSKGSLSLIMKQKHLEQPKNTIWSKNTKDDTGEGGDPQEALQVQDLPEKEVHIAN
jgi:hypothetical protein